MEGATGSNDFNKQKYRRYFFSRPQDIPGYISCDKEENLPSEQEDNVIYYLDENGKLEKLSVPSFDDPFEADEVGDCINFPGESDKVSFPKIEINKTPIPTKSDEKNCNTAELRVMQRITDDETIKELVLTSEGLTIKDEYTEIRKKEHNVEVPEQQVEDNYFSITADSDTEDAAKNSLNKVDVAPEEIENNKSFQKVPTTDSVVELKEDEIKKDTPKIVEKDDILPSVPNLG